MEKYHKTDIAPIEKENERDDAVLMTSFVLGSDEAAQNQPLPKKKKEAAEITSLRKDNAAYKQQLEIKNRDSKDLFNLVQEQERKLRTSEKAYRMVTDIIATYPDEFEALLSKARQKKNPPTYFNGNRNGGGNTK